MMRRFRLLALGTKQGWMGLLLAGFLLSVFCQNQISNYLRQICQTATQGLSLTLDRIPTAWFVAGAVVVLALIALWVEKETSIASIRDVVQIIFENAESIAVVAAVILYFKEIPERRAQKHYEAWQVVDAAANVTVSYARIRALEDLNRDKVSLKGITAVRANLEAIALKGAILTEANLAEANLYAADLMNAVLMKICLERATLKQANLNRSDLTAANLHAATLTQVNLTSANLTGANLTSAQLAYADLSGSTFTGAALIEVKAVGSNFYYAKLYEANLSQGNFAEANFTEADLTGANLTGANFRGVTGLTAGAVRKANYWESAVFDPELAAQLGIASEP
ncbi:pentapeptide repeat-containing protein [Leptolyngbya sp. AN03gr2]|uniref:pentapeptide repeat-containing protein n=1 Tax=unclassified Leptolyngbya TaxID=2650499 RepID=UPI003D32334D